jgi:hypothetical protein
MPILLTCLYDNEGSRVYYLDSSHSIRELGWNNGWYVSDPLAAANSEAAANSDASLDSGPAWDTPLTCLYAGESCSRVYYVDSNNRIRELAWNGNHWDASGELA